MSKNIFFQETLCPMYIYIFEFCADQQKHGEIHKVWTYKGIVNVLFSDEPNEKPMKFEHYDDLWEYFPN